MSKKLSKTECDEESRFEQTEKAIRRKEQLVRRRDHVKPKQPLSKGVPNKKVCP